MNSETDFVEEYAKRVLTNPDWRIEHTRFVNAQILQANAFYKRLILSPNGLAKFMRVTGATQRYAKAYLEYCQKS